MTLAKDIYGAHVSYMKEGHKTDIAAWEELTESERLYWQLLSVAALANIGIPTESMIEAAVKEMKRPRMVEETRLEDALAKQFERFYKASIIVKIKAELAENDVSDLA